MNPTNIPASVDALVDKHRTRCLWFLRPDYYPATTAERIRVLEYIERYGGREAFREPERDPRARGSFQPPFPPKTSAASTSMVAGRPYAGSADRLARDLEQGHARFHAGRIGGVLPLLIGPG